MDGSSHVGCGLEWDGVVGGSHVGSAYWVPLVVPTVDWRPPSWLLLLGSMRVAILDPFIGCHLWGGGRPAWLGAAILDPLCPIVGGHLGSIASYWGWPSWTHCVPSLAAILDPLCPTVGGHLGPIVSSWWQPFWAYCVLLLAAILDPLCPTVDGHLGPIASYWGQPSWTHCVPLLAAILGLLCPVGGGHLGPILSHWWQPS